MASPAPDTSQQIIDKFNIPGSGVVLAGSARHYFNCGNGWHQLIDQMLTQLSKQVKADDIEPVTVLWVRQREGILSTLIKGNTETISGILRIYREKSKRICEQCGGPSSLRLLDKSHTTQCDNCIASVPKKIRIAR